MTDPTGYGRDLWCYDGLRSGRLATGKQLVAQACYRRLTTPRGTLRGSPGAATYGIDLADYLGAVGEGFAVAALPGIVRAELLKDDRVSDVSVKIQESRGSDGLVALTLTIDVALSDSGEQFALTLEVSNAGTALIGGIT